MKRNKKRTRYGVRQPQQAQQPQKQAAPAGPAASQPAAADVAPNVTPEQQATYSRFVNDCYRILFDQRAFQATLQMVGRGDPVQGLAQAAAMIVMQVQERYQKSQQPLTPSPILLRGSLEVLSTMAQVVDHAKIHTFAPEEIAKAATTAIALYTKQATPAGLFNADQAKQEATEYPPNVTFAPALAPGALAKMVASAPKPAPSKHGPILQKTPPGAPMPPPAAAAAAVPAAGRPPSQQVGLLSQGAQ